MAAQGAALPAYLALGDENPQPAQEPHFADPQQEPVLDPGAQQQQGEQYAVDPNRGPRSNGTLPVCQCVEMCEKCCSHCKCTDGTVNLNYVCCKCPQEVGAKILICSTGNCCKCCTGCRCIKHK